MIFDVSSSQIECLDSKQLVELLKKLLHAEAQCSGISLRGVSVPLQITVSDGGEDARISWAGGLKQTDYLPSRFCIFQSKATDPQPAGWKKEVWTKSSQRNGSTRQLNEAVAKAVSERGAYIGFTSAVLIGSKYDKRIEGIKQGIRETGANPDHLKAIDIYDANKIADWVCKHPSIAVWLNEKQSDLKLRGFQTIDRLGTKIDIASIPQIEDKASRFRIGSKSTHRHAQHEFYDENSLTFEKVKERIADHLVDSKNFIRLIGSSGVGKTRFVYEVFRDQTTISRIVLTTSTIYCDLRDVGSQIFQIAQGLVGARRPTLMIVDECPRETAVKLCEIVSNENSDLRILTIGNDSQSIEKDNCLTIFVEPADDTLIEGIIQQRYPKANYSDINFIRDLSGGYPRIAVLATDNYLEGSPILKSVEDVVERILTGCGINHVEQVRAIECLSLFKQLGADENLSDEIDFVAENLARQTGDEMYEHLAYAAKQHLVDHRGCYFIAQPLPIAAFLARRRLDLLRVKKILTFIESAPPTLRTSFLNQWRYFDSSQTVAVVTQRLLTRNGWCGSLEALKTEIGQECLSAVVHIDPDGVTDMLRYIYGDLSVDELKEAVTGKRNFVQVLSILVSRKKSFHVAALLLVRLAATEDESYFKDASNRFKQLFQLSLSETEAEPVDRYAILDQELSFNDERTIPICIEALENTLKRNYFSGSGIYNQIGNQPPLKEWTPKVWGEVFDFHRSGLQRLNSIRSQHKQFAVKCEKIIASHMRSLLCENLLDDLENTAKSIAKEKGIWLEAIEGIGDWLYFDREKAPEDFSRKVRQLYDDLIPTNPIERALLYTKFWTADIHDPDLTYNREDRSNQDFEYSSRKAREVAAKIGLDKQLSYRAIQTMAREELNNVFPFTEELATKLEDPAEAFQIALRAFELSNKTTGIQFLRGLLAGIDKRDSEVATQCIQIALESGFLKDQMVNIYTAVKISVERLDEIVQSVRKGYIAPTACVYFSYGRGLDHLEAESILPLINELAHNHGSEGMWASLEIIFMYQHNKEALESPLAQSIQQLITSQRLLESTKTATRDGHLFEQLILLVQKHCGINDSFGTELSNQIVRLCQVKDYQIFSALDTHCRNIIRLLVEEKPKQLWRTLSHFFEIATPSELHYLKALVGPLEHTFDGESHNKEGILFGIPEAEFLTWARVKPDIRSPFLCIFYPVIEVDKTGHHKWHPALEGLTYEFGASNDFRVALARRLHPKSWSGSIVPHLEIYVTLLKKWFTHPVREMSFWSKDLSRSLERQIDRERNLY